MFKKKINVNLYLTNEQLSDSLNYKPIKYEILEVKENYCP